MLFLILIERRLSRQTTAHKRVRVLAHFGPTASFEPQSTDSHLIHHAEVLINPLATSALRSCAYLDHISQPFVVLVKSTVLQGKCRVSDTSYRRSRKQSATLSVVMVVKKLRGGSQSRLVLCDDGNLYILKMHPNPQGPNVLANEVFGAALLRGLGFTVPDWRVITIDLATLELFEELAFETPEGRSFPAFGLHFGSRYFGERAGDLVDYVPACYQHKVRNREQLDAVKLFDLWADHRDQRQCLFRRVRTTGEYEACFIDNGHLFGGPDWAGPKQRLEGDGLAVKLRTLVEPDLSQQLVGTLKRRAAQLLSDAVRMTPLEWYKGNVGGLLSQYTERIDLLRGLIDAANRMYVSEAKPVTTDQTGS